MFDRAMIVVTADHGEQFEDHGLWRHSNSLYQQLLHVPLIVKFPGQHEGRVVREPVGTIDIVPSIMKMLGGSCERCDGRPLQDAGKVGPRVVYSYLMDHQQPTVMMRSVVADGWKLIRSQKGDMDAEELFFLDQDPNEQHDVRATETDRVTRLRGLLERYEAEAGPTEAAETIKLKPADVARLKALGYVQ
jgi:arylsulfatase A-like enzyme